MLIFGEIGADSFIDANWKFFLLVNAENWHSPDFELKELEGLPYQTLISSLIHKYTNGLLVDK